MELESSAPDSDQIDSPQRATRGPGRDAPVLRDAEDPRMGRQPGDVKRRSTGIRCPYCRFRCRAAFSFQVHVGSQHPAHCEDVSVGRLGKAVFYQCTAKLFHCQICFFTSRDHTAVLEHLLVRHCCTAHTAEDRGGEAETELTHAERREQSEDGDVDKSDSRLQRGLGVYQCPYCESQCSLLDLHQHLNQCSAPEQNQERGDTVTEEEL